EYVFILTFIVSQQNWTLSMLVASLIGEWRFVDYGKLAAVSLYYMIPVVIFFLFFQKYLLRLSIASKGPI
ncbi:MAG: carbohydrate ABC transporter permease, partial [Thermoprotei archaeon]